MIIGTICLIIGFFGVGKTVENQTDVTGQTEVQELSVRDYDLPIVV